MMLKVSLVQTIGLELPPHPPPHLLPHVTDIRRYFKKSTFRRVIGFCVAVFLNNIFGAMSPPTPAQKPI